MKTNSESVYRGVNGRERTTDAKHGYIARLRRGDGKNETGSCGCGGETRRKRMCMNSEGKQPTPAETNAHGQAEDGTAKA